MTDQQMLDTIDVVKNCAAELGAGMDADQCVDKLNAAIKRIGEEGRLTAPSLP